MSVDDWARREAERQYPRTYRYDGDDWPNPGSQEMRDGATWMAQHLADAFLSDEAVEAAARGVFAEEQCDKRQKASPEALEENWATRLNESDHDEYRSLARAAIEAAIDAATKETRND